jgi:patatin-like phospholipase/acyl hydrolase
MTNLTVWNEKYAAPRPRRLLALDGGGILGVMSLEILAKIEEQLAAATRAGQRFRLGDYFDYIGGTSTGAIIATGLAAGLRVQDLLEFYDKAGPLMFEKRFLLRRVRSLYEADPLREMLQQILGERKLVLVICAAFCW